MAFYKKKSILIVFEDIINCQTGTSTKSNSLLTKYKLTINKLFFKSFIAVKELLVQRTFEKSAIDCFRKEVIFRIVRK